MIRRFFLKLFVLTSRKDALRLPHEKHMNQWQIYQLARSLTLLDTILRNKNKVDEKTNGIRALPRIVGCFLAKNDVRYRRCPELRDAISARLCSAKRQTYNETISQTASFANIPFASPPFMTAWSIHGSLQSDRKVLRTKAYPDVENVLNVATTS